jgi:hypothetical protein
MRYLKRRYFFLKLCCSKRNSKTFQRQLTTVTASALDREFSGIKAYVSLEGDQSIWQNKWNAGKRNYLGHDSL